MASLRKRLDELVADAGERLVRRGEVAAWCDVRHPADAEVIEEAAGLAREMVGEAAAAASQGDYRRACHLAELDPPWPSSRHWAVETLLGWGVSLHESPAWMAFREACALAERIDCFLVAVGRGPQGAGLAADCRECLETLLVLADWCDDQGRPAAAAEARHLHALACGLP